MSISCIALLHDPKSVLYDHGLAAYPVDGIDLLTTDLSAHPQLQSFLAPLQEEWKCLDPAGQAALRAAATATPKKLLSLEEEIPNGWYQPTGRASNTRVSHALLLHVLGAGPASELNMEVEHPSRKRFRLANGDSASLSATYPGAKSTRSSCPLCGEPCTLNQLQGSHLVPAEGYRKFLQRTMSCDDFAAVVAAIKSKPSVVRYLNISWQPFFYSMRNEIALCPLHNVVVKAGVFVSQESVLQVLGSPRTQTAPGDGDHDLVKHRCHGNAVPAVLQQQFVDLGMEPYLLAHNELMEILGPYSVTLRESADCDTDEDEDDLELELDLAYWRSKAIDTTYSRVSDWHCRVVAPPAGPLRAVKA